LLCFNEMIHQNKIWFGLHICILTSLKIITENKEYGRDTDGFGLIVLIDKHKKKEKRKRLTQSWTIFPPQHHSIMGTHRTEHHT